MIALTLPQQAIAYSCVQAIALFLRVSARRPPTMPSSNQRSQHTKKTQTMSVSNTNTFIKITIAIAHPSTTGDV
ncbi:hypothetical protein H6G97_18650 [Nostoc flagelliforme FACHB-838]|uniref:Secreted protein n=1 Tax=Nostoc flagelliforme FACHB-838 TaxID=2692904 RepID=A0ABR8DPX9_9NOSO|nr:hypothetical protein [Nostoc flagelliforme]MBD2531496.1 hypothetical protein [Nostoc flagelliforme FACHB-838]